MERWRDIPRYKDRYQISDHGRVKNITNGKNRILGTIVCDYGYYRRVMRYTVDGLVKHKNERIHRLVAKEFIPNPENLPMVNHLDGNKLNNHYTNLEWTDSLGNVQHAIINDLRRPSGMGHEVFSVEDVKTIRTKFEDTDVTLAELADEYNTTTQNVYNVVTYITWGLVNPELKDTYKASSISRDVYANTYPNKGFTKRTVAQFYDNEKPWVSIGVPDRKALDELVIDYVNGTDAIYAFAKTRGVSKKYLTRYIKNLEQVPMIVLENETFKEYVTNRKLLISNLGRVFDPNIYKFIDRGTINGIKVSKIIVETFIRELEEGEGVRIIDKTKPITLNNLRIYTPSPEVAYKPKKLPYVLTEEMRETIIDEYQNTNITYIGIHTKYKVPHKVIAKTLKEETKLANKRAKIEPEIVLGIRSDYYRKGMAINTIAGNRELSTDLVYKVVNHKIHPDLVKHIEDMTVKITRQHEKMSEELTGKF